MLEIRCKERYRKMVDLAREHGDKTLEGCFSRLLYNSTHELVDKVVVYSDYEEHSFYFETEYKDGRKGICGGIIFHGFPGEGYQENGSVMLSPSYGWSTHT